LVFVRNVTLRQVRNLEEQTVELAPGLNLFLGPNAQGKTSFLEAVGLLARGRSFRTDDLGEVALRGGTSFAVEGQAAAADRETRLGLAWTRGARRFSVDERPAAPREYQGRLEACVYSTDRLRIVHGPMRERRQHVDRSGAALSAAYRQNLRDYERIVRQRNAALEAGRRDAAAWDERLQEEGGRLRARRLQYVARLDQALASAFRPAGETYAIAAEPAAAASFSEAEHQRRLAEEVRQNAARERAAGRSLVGPHRDAVHLLVNGVDATLASSGQVRSFLLALTEATLRVYREQTGNAAVALLDDLDSELDAPRARAVCRALAGHGQTLVTSAHPEWAAALIEEGRTFQVAGGRVTAS
jgi:DNA replication and repair protein RecF